MPETPIIERAFQIARSGTCPTVRDVRAHLRMEGYTLVDDFITGRTLVATLKRLCETSFSASRAETMPSDTEA